MQIEFKAAADHEKALIRRMMELYNYDFSEFDGADLDDHGWFGYSHLDHYWTEADRHPFILRVDGKLAGFAFVSKHTYIVEYGYSIAEFFVMKKYRQRGIGRQMAFYLFDLFPGKWEVRQMDENKLAQKFWRKVIDEYTSGSYEEFALETESWVGPVQIFESAATGRT